MIKNKKSQVWSLDAIAAMVIFFAGVVILYLYAINFSSQSNELDSLIYQANTASSIILSDDQTYGILTDGKIDKDKLNDFYNLDYQSVRSGLSIKDNFYFVIDGLEINGESKDYIGLMNIEAKSNVQTTRFVIYKNKIVKFQIYVWR